MHSLLPKFFALLLFLIPMSSSAVPISTSTGFIDNQGRDWIQIGNTAGGSFTWHDIANVCDPASGACSGSIYREYANQWLDLTGYQWALRVEVNDLFESFFGSVPLASGEYAVDFTSARELMSEILPTYGVGSGEWMNDPYDPYTDIWWVIADGFTRDALTRSYLRLRGGAHGPSYSHVAHGNANNDFGDIAFGIWAYRSVNVPEPSILVLLFTGLLGLGLARRSA